MTAPHSDILTWFHRRLQPAAPGVVGLDKHQLFCDFSWWHYARHRIHADPAWADNVMSALHDTGVRRQQLRKPFHSYATWNVDMAPNLISPKRCFATDVQAEIAFKTFRTFPWQEQRFHSRLCATSYALYRYSFLTVVSEAADAACHPLRYVCRWQPHSRQRPDGNGTLYLLSQQLPSELLGGYIDRSHVAMSRAQ